MPDPIDYPWAVVTIYPDGSGVALDEHESQRAAALDAEGVRRLGYEAHVVPLGDLLAWVRSNAREGRT